MLYKDFSLQAALTNLQICELESSEILSLKFFSEFCLENKFVISQNFEEDFQFSLEVKDKSTVVSETWLRSNYIDRS